MEDTFSSLINFAIESENFDLLLSLVQGADYIPEVVLDRINKFVRNFNIKHNIGCDNIDCFPSAYFEWKVNNTEEQQLPQFVAEMNPTEPNILSVLDFIDDKEFSNSEYLGAVIYWIILYGAQFDWVKTRVEAIARIQVANPVNNKLFLEGFVKEAALNENWSPVDVFIGMVRRNGSLAYRTITLTGNVDNYMSYLTERDFADMQYDFFTSHKELYSLSKEVQFAFGLANRKDCEEKTKKQLADYAASHHYNIYMKNKDDILKLDNVFYQYLLYALAKNEYIRELARLIRIRPIDPDFDPLRLDREQIATSIQSAMSLSIEESEEEDSD